ncbi:substrate-binding domain-containing protein [Rhodoferax sp. GW822-FHT02A01]|uniref:substrate-binding domain-containing protein n=1 Tax=Rhodoferax sp. GW822-FHT02A01 TaxID=3141537 RepID=UPI00315C7692
MHRIQFHYTLSRTGSPAQVRNPLIDLLQAVSTHGSISAGARALGLSYRHVWGELKRWEQELGSELLIWEKGQSARLTEFGSKLMWAEGQAQARLAPQIEALRSELERAFAIAFDPQAHVAMLYASHDDALGTLREFALGDGESTSPARVHLDIRFSGSVDAIRALNEGRCVMAGFHTVQNPVPGSVAEKIYKPLLKPGLHKIIGFATRTQGLMVAAGNPLQLNSLQDVQERNARFINRPLGTGTRVVLDELLRQSSLDATQFPGYAHTEPSHVAVAHAIASGMADVGLGIEVAARAHGLGFVPLLEENYHLVCLKSALDDPAIQALMVLLQSEAWQARLSTLPGYRAWHSGEVQSLRKVLPWWTFGSKTPG